jgi:isopentenyl diphosphate isomerase/L-lactate dehydrogenase-like FMN-dependent dehydrogenase
MSVADAQQMAKKRLPKGMYDAIATGAGRELTLRWNEEAFNEVAFQPRWDVQNAPRDLSTTVLGHTISLPVMIAPTGHLRMFHVSGEPAVARAAGEAGTIHMVSCFMGYPIEEITAAATGPVFFDMYIAGGRDNVETMLDRAKKAGCTALVITVDIVTGHGVERPAKERVFTPMIGMNFATIMRFGPQLLSRPRWAFDFIRDGMHLDTPMWIKPDGKTASFGEMAWTILSEAPTWDDLPWIREHWDGPIIVKGVLHPDDARRAAAEGVNGIVVSNHGGRNVDGSPATLWALPAMVEAANGEVEVYLDGGVRRGTDVVKALALGARAVLLGRAYVWAQAAAGGAGVARMLNIFRSEIDSTLASLGCPSVAALDPSYIRLLPSWRGPLGSTAGSREPELTRELL